ncbi:MAG: hypothetical protein RL685_998 [Pseudomonadota bacterium]|jgi:hypothetical protein
MVHVSLHHRSRLTDPESSRASCESNTKEAGLRVLALSVRIGNIATKAAVYERIHSCAQGGAGSVLEEHDIAPRHARVTLQGEQILEQRGYPRYATLVRVDSDANDQDERNGAGRVPWNDGGLWSSARKRRLGVHDVGVRTEECQSALAECLALACTHAQSVFPPESCEALGLDV